MTPDIVIILTAFFLGLLGSIHCMGMCAGIAGMLHTPTTNRPEDHTRGRRMKIALVYNGGRISSYMLAGAIAAQTGISLLGLLGAQAGQILAQMIGGLFMMLLGLYLAGWGNALAPLERLGLKLWQGLSPLARYLLPIDRYHRIFVAGILWGWLPCGLVYSALALVLVSGDPLIGTLAMAAFGLGTLPLVSALSFLRGEEWLMRQPIVRKVAGTVILLFGAVLFTGLIAPHGGGLSS